MSALWSCKVPCLGDWERGMLGNEHSHQLRLLRTEAGQRAALHTLSEAQQRLEQRRLEVAGLELRLRAAQVALAQAEQEYQASLHHATDARERTQQVKAGGAALAQDANTRRPRWDPSRMAA